MKQSDLLMMELMVDGLMAQPDTPEELKEAVAETKQKLQELLDNSVKTETGKQALALALMSFLRKFSEIIEKTL